MSKLLSEILKLCKVLTSVIVSLANRTFKHISLIRQIVIPHYYGKGAKKTKVLMSSEQQGKCVTRNSLLFIAVAQKDNPNLLYTTLIRRCFKRL